MKISEFYNMKTVRKEYDWWYNDYILQLLTGESDYDFVGDKTVHTKLAIENKLYTNQDYERGVSYDVLSFEEKPFCLVIRSGEDLSDYTREYITCRDTYEKARKYILNLIAEDEEEIEDISQDVDIEDLEQEYGYFVYNDEKTNSYKLVSREAFVFNDKEEKYVIDKDEMRNNFEEKVRKFSKDLPCSPINDKKFMNIYRKTIMETVRLPEQDKVVISNKEKNIIGAVRFKNEYFYVMFSEWHISDYLSWCLEEGIEKVDDKDLECVKKLFM